MALTRLGKAQVLNTGREFPGLEISTVSSMPSPLLPSAAATPRCLLDGVRRRPPASSGGDDGHPPRRSPDWSTAAVLLE